MARKNRCYLCGGALRRGRCVECGLDNDRMTKRTYRLNETTPVHIKRKQIEAQRSEQIKYAKEYKKEQHSLENLGKDQDLRRNQRRDIEKQRVSASKQDKKHTINQQIVAAKRELKHTMDRQIKQRQQAVSSADEKIKTCKPVKVIVLIYAILMFFSAAKGCLIDGVEEITDAFSDYVEYEDYEERADELVSPYIDEEEYLYAGYEIAETGTFYEVDLTQGNYLVGVHVPEGIYRIDTLEGYYGSVWVKDSENCIYLSMSFGEDGEYEYAENVRLYEGAYLQIYGTVSLHLQTDHAGETAVSEGGLSDVSGVLEEENLYLVGDEIPEGIYDLEVLDGWAILTCSYEDEDGNVIETSYWLDADELDSTCKNVPMLAGMEVSVEDGTVIIQSSDWYSPEAAKKLYEKMNY